MLVILIPNHVWNHYRMLTNKHGKQQLQFRLLGSYISLSEFSQVFFLHKLINYLKMLKEDPWICYFYSDTCTATLLMIQINSYSGYNT